MARVPNVVPKERAFHPMVRAARRVASSGISCPACGSVEVRRSDRWTFRDFLFAGFFLAPFRCRFCRTRFYWFWRPSLKKRAKLVRAPLLRIPRQVLELYPVDPYPAALDSATLHSAALDTTALAIIEAQPVRVTRPRSVLILERDPSIRKLLCRLLDRRGYFTHEVIQAGDLPDELRSRRVDLLIIGAPLAGANILDSALALAGVHPNLKILALPLEPLEGPAIPGRCLVLPKPFSLDAFLERIDRLLEPAIPAGH